jgi:hypothetical protein
MSDMSSDIAKDNYPEEQICLLYALSTVPVANQDTIPSKLSHT